MLPKTISRIDTPKLFIYLLKRNQRNGGYVQITDNLRRVVYSSWYLREPFRSHEILEEMKKQYSSPGQVPEEIMTYVLLPGRNRLNEEVEKALDGNDSPHIFLEVIRKIEPRSDELSGYPIFTDW